MKKNLNSFEVAELKENLHCISNLREITKSKEFKCIKKMKYSIRECVEYISKFELLINLPSINSFALETIDNISIELLSKYFKKYSSYIFKYLNLEMNIIEAVEFHALISKLNKDIINTILPKINKTMIKYYEKYNFITNLERIEIEVNALDYEKSFEEEKEKTIYCEYMNFLQKFISKCTGKTVLKVTANDMWDKENDKWTIEYECAYEHSIQWVEEMKKEAGYYTSEHNTFDDVMEEDIWHFCIIGGVEFEKELIELDMLIDSSSSCTDVEVYIINENLHIDIPEKCLYDITIDFYIALIEVMRVNV